jgi:hypothetical protein
MPPSVELKDLVTFLELGKGRAEVSFKLEVQKASGADAALLEQAEAKLRSVQGQLDALWAKIESAGVRFAVPNEHEIARLNALLSSRSAKELAECMARRQGEAYETLSARGALLKRNYEGRESIAQLALLLARLQKDVRDSLAEQVRRGKLDAPVPILKAEEPLGREIALVLGRLGMPAELREGSLVSAPSHSEVAVQLQNRRVWVSPEVRDKLNENMRMIADISPQIQVKNAVRYVKNFSDEEEREFAAIQNEYLRLLKEQDALLRPCGAEEMP